MSEVIELDSDPDCFMEDVDSNDIFEDYLSPVLTKIYAQIAQPT